MKRFKSKKAVALLAVLALALAGGAYAYWTSSDGTGTGTGPTGNLATGLHVTQTSDTGPAFTPGGTGQVLGGTVESTVAAGGATVFVHKVTVTLATPTGGSNTPHACSTSDYEFAAGGGWTISTTTTANDTASHTLNANLAPLASVPWSGLNVDMVDKTDTVPGDGLGNQDGCKLATLNFNYVASAS